MCVLNYDIAGVHNFFKTKSVWLKQTIYPQCYWFSNNTILFWRLPLSDTIWEDVMCQLEYHTNMKFNISSEDSQVKSSQKFIGINIFTCPSPKIKIGGLN